MAFGAHFDDFGSLLGSLLETILDTFWVPFLHRFLDPPKTSKKGRGSWVVRTLSPPSSDSSPLVNPLRVLPRTHRTHWASQSFPEQQTSVSTEDICPVQTAGLKSWLLLAALGCSWLTQARKSKQPSFFAWKTEGILSIPNFVFNFTRRI